MDTCICVTECLRCSPDTNTALSVNLLCHCCSVSKSHPVLQPHGLQLTRRLCPPLSPEVCSNPCLLSKSAILQYKIKRFFKKESIVETNLIWITFLYTWNEQNSVNQLYFNVVFWKWGISNTFSRFDILLSSGLGFSVFLSPPCLCSHVPLPGVPPPHQPSTSPYIAGSIYPSRLSSPSSKD